MAKFLRYEPCPKCTEAGRDRRGDNLAVYLDGGFHCFACGYHKGLSIPWAEPVKDDLNGSKGVLPADFSREVPAAAWKWLLQYGLSWKYWSPFVGWSERHSRLILTVGDPITFSIGRLIEDRVEGRTGRGERKWHTYGEAHTRAHIIGGGHEKGPTCLVEDLISAHKVGQITTCLPLFGTRVFPSIATALRHLNRPVLMWLDKDQEGVAARRASHLSLLTNLPVKYVFTEDDPKNLALSSIKEQCEKAFSTSI